MTYAVGTFLRGRYDGRLYRVERVDEDDGEYRLSVIDMLDGVTVLDSDWWDFDEVHSHWDVENLKVDPTKKLSGFGKFVRNVVEEKVA